MAIKLIKSYTTTLTHDLAVKWRDMKSYKGERNLKKDRLDILREKHARGEFTSPTWACIHFNGQVIRANGQHSSNMLASLGDKFPKGLTVHIEEFDVDSEEEIPVVFMKYDQPFSNRTQTDTVGSIVARDPAFEGFPKTNLMRVANGIVWHKNQGIVQLSVNDRAMALLENVPFCIACRRFIKRDRYRRVPVIAAMYATWLANKDGFELFWDRVFFESDPNPQAPARVLARFLQEASSGKESKFQNEVVYAKCVHAWNAFRRNSTTKLSVFKDKKLPVAV